MSEASKFDSCILDRIGNTPLVELKSIVPSDCARVLIKIEAENPTGSLKDRMALAMVEAAEKDGRLKPGGHVIEYTGGSTGVSLAMVCAVKGYKASIVTSDAFSIEKRNHMAAFGADLTLVRSVDGGLDETLTRTMVETARQIQERTGGFWANQLSNPDQIDGYHKMGEEIWNQTEGKLDAFVHFVGTAGSIRGVSEVLNKYNQSVHCVGIEPSESPVLSGGETGVHKIEGVGAGYVVPLWKPEAVDELVAISTEECIETARRLVEKEGIFAGTSTGGNVAKAIEIGRRLGPDATVVTLMCDSGVKYLSTPLYRDASNAVQKWV